MKLPALVFVFRWLIRDTFCQAFASGIFWLMLLVCGVGIGFCLSVQVVGDAPLSQKGAAPDFLPRTDSARALAATADLCSWGASVGDGTWRMPLPLVSTEYQQVQLAVEQGVPLVQGELRLAFGAIRVPLGRGRVHAVHLLELELATWVVGGTGLLLALIWTAGFLPSFLEGSSATVLLAKPVSRWTLLAGKFVGVASFVAVQVTLFVAGTWLALGIRTGVWDATFFRCIPLELIDFAVFFSFSTLLAVTTRSTVGCVFGSVVFWFLCWGMNYGRHAVMLTPQFSESPVLLHLVDAGYWLLPKPADLGMILKEALNVPGHHGGVLDGPSLRAKGLLHPGWSMISSLFFSGVMFVCAARHFDTKDY